MQVFLRRIYLEKATHGILSTIDQTICSSLELPWRNNLPRISCIPEGRYLLAKRYSRKFGWHICVKGVMNRAYILFHPANDALRDLKGCIAPVTQLTREGYGIMSRAATQKFKRFVDAALDRGEFVELIVEPFKNK